MLEIYGGIVTTPANSREDFLNIPVPINEDWRIVEIRFSEHVKALCLVEVHFNRDRRHTIWASHFSPPFAMDEMIVGGTYITVIAENRTVSALQGAFYILVERERIGA